MSAVVQTGQPQQHYYELTDKICDDACAQRVRQLGNQSIADYHLHTRSLMPGDMRSRAQAIVDSTPSMRYADALDPSVIDIDTSVRYRQALTQTRGRQQMNVRYFHAVPNLSKGAGRADVESELLTGHDSTNHRQASHKLAEVDFYRFVPFVDLVKSNLDGYTNTPEVHTIGIDSRELLRKEKQAGR